MNLKKLERRLIELTNDNKIKLTTKNVGFEIEELFEDKIKKVLQLNCALGDTLYIEEEYNEVFEVKKDRGIYKIICSTLRNLIEKERAFSKIVVIELISELLKNKDLFSILGDSLPNLVKILKFKEEYPDYDVEDDDILEWFDEWLDYIELEDIEDDYIFDLIDEVFEDYYNLDILTCYDLNKTDNMEEDDKNERI